MTISKAEIQRRINEMVKKNISLIEEHGWTAMSVFDPKGIDMNYTYSMGFAPICPEILISGLSGKLAHDLIHSIYTLFTEKDELIREGYNFKVANLPCYFIRISEENKRLRCTQAFNVHGTWDFEVLQLVWTDTKSNMPWDAGYEESYEDSQDLYGPSPTQRRKKQ